MLGNLCVLLFIVLFLLDMMLMFIYCRVMEIVDKKISARLIDNEDNKDRDEKEKRKKNSFFRQVMKFVLNHYLYGLMRYSILCVGKIPSHKVRNFLYRFVFNMKITRKTVIYGGCEIRAPWNIYADNCVISNRCLLDGRNGIRIGDNVVFGGGVHVWTEEHDVHDVYFRVNAQNRKPVVIESRAWICSDSTILPGVTIKEGVVLASRACATKDCEAYGIYAGIPAKKIEDRNHELVYELSGKPHWYFY